MTVIIYNYLWDTTLISCRSVSAAKSVGSYDTNCERITKTT